MFSRMHWMGYWLQLHVHVIANKMVQSAQLPRGDILSRFWRTLMHSQIDLVCQVKVDVLLSNSEVIS